MPSDMMHSAEGKLRAGKTEGRGKLIRLYITFEQVMHEAIRAARSGISSQLHENKERLRKNINRFLDKIGEKLLSLYEKNGIPLQVPISKVRTIALEENFSPSNAGAPCLYIESKYRTKERWVFKGLGDKSYVSYRMRDVGEFKESCRQRVEAVFQEAACYVKSSMKHAVAEQELPLFQEQLQQVVEIFEERLQEVENELELYEKQKEDGLRLKGKLLSFLDAPKIETMQK
jgi:predicted ribosome quality control (RQC) complex YloA/Tae2 family protein